MIKLNKLSIEDKEIFARYLGFSQHRLSVYAFINIYIWRGIFDIYWTLLKENLCVFFKDKTGCFLYLEPLSKRPNPEVIREVFSIMDEFNQNKDISRIENIEEETLPFYRTLGYICKDKPGDYLCQSQDLVQLKGNRFKSKRAAFNYFVKHNKFEYLPFSLKCKNDCLKLYNLWKEKRKAQNLDPFYQGMLEDSLNCLKVLFDDYPFLYTIGRVVKMNGEIKAFTFGFELNPDTFCILYEITDLSIKGLSQFIFRQFCVELKDYRYINIMDDSGLANLKRVKLSYHPQRLISSYIVTRL